MQVIQSVTIATIPCFVIAVGGEHNGRVIIEIQDAGAIFEDNVYSSYHVLDENRELIVSIENAPVIVEYRQIAEHDENEK
ncbi:MAG: hypothetical protein ACQEXV_21345 [Bacillota bacterium]